jgi:arylsulfatase
MKESISFAFIYCLLLLGQGTVFAQRPNIVLIMTDDQGYGDLGVTGNSFIHTPHIDNFAAQSTHFSNFYVDPVCAPTRSALMTGKFYLRTGIYDTFNGGAIMDPDEITIAEILAAHGYQTGIFGKWHLGDNYPARPSDQGFAASLIHKAGGIGQPGDLENFPQPDSSYFDPVLFKNNHSIRTKGYCTDVFTDGALDFLEQNKEHPFFMYVAYNAPHGPLQVPEKYLERYADLDFGLNDRETNAAKRVYAMVENVDENVGRILNCLEEHEILENTIVIFMTDNGPIPARYNAGLRGTKSSVYEGGTKVPFFIRYPAVFEAGHKIPTRAGHIDVLPTLLDLCGLQAHIPEEIDGRSLLPILEGDAAFFESRPFYWQWARGYPELYANVAIRQGDYKLIGHAESDADISQFELFDIAADPFEQHNLIGTEKAKARELKEQLDAWYRQIVIEEGNPKSQGCIINPAFENPVVLNRNDAKGSPEQWTRDGVYSFWDVEFEEAGYYDITFTFHKKPERTGKVVIKFAPLQYSKINRDTSIQELTLHDCYFKKGRGHLEAYYRQDFNSVISPLSLSIEKK